MQDSMFIGLDVHKATISVAVAQGGRGGEVRHWGTVLHRPDHVRKLVDKLGAVGGKLHFCYEAGPCGYGLHRQLVELGHDCTVVAPSLIPVKAGDRVKTDRRDAVMLAKLHRAGELTAVWVPDAAHEAMRDLVRARATAMRVTGKARQHLQGFLLRHSRVHPGKKGWTVAYRRWLTTVRFYHPAKQVVFQDYVDVSTQLNLLRLPPQGWQGCHYEVPHSSEYRGGFGCRGSFASLNPPDTWNSMITAHISLVDGSGKKGVAPAKIRGEKHCAFLNPVISHVARICIGSAANVSSRIRPIFQYDDGGAAVRGASHSR